MLDNPRNQTNIPRKGNVKTTEVRDVIHGPIELYPWEIAVVDSPAFQRLRNIKQLGFSEFAYPCAVHNRYIHSIGASHLAGTAFQGIFKNHFFSDQSTYHHYYYLARISALLHDIGHGPFSHAIEHAMPSVAKLALPSEVSGKDTKRQASHEDYSLKIILDSSLTPVLEKNFSRFGITPWHIACVMNLSLKEKDDFFKDRGVSFRKVLHQIISSEMDADRMDYLQRDSYYTGVSYGKFDANWLLTNLSVYIEKSAKGATSKLQTAHLALSDRAIYTFEDFLLSRYHMFLMVYLHHKSVCYEKMMEKYLHSPTCTFTVPEDVEAYLRCDDSVVYEYLRRDAAAGNDWADRILRRRHYKVAVEWHESVGDPGKSKRATEFKAKLKEKGIDYFEAASGKGLSNYVKPNLGSLSDEETTIFVETYDRLSGEVNFRPLEEFTEIFRKYAQEKSIYRIYVPESAKIRELGV